MRFGLKTLLAALAVTGIGIWFVYVLPQERDRRRIAQIKGTLDPYEAEIAAHNPIGEPPAELLTVLGDSRLRHWGMVRLLSYTPAQELVSHGRDGMLAFWNTSSGKQLAHVVDVQAATLSADAAGEFCGG